MTLLKVQDVSNLYRDSENMALISKDKNGLEEYNRRRMYMTNQKEELNTIKSELNDINNDISEIKELLQLLLNKG